MDASPQAEVVGKLERDVGGSVKVDESFIICCCRDDLVDSPLRENRGVLSVIKCIL
jgi:hypothetical protein